jgi:hypothetical protein
MTFICSSYNLGDDLLRDWFFIPGKDGMPRNLRIIAWDDDSINHFIGQVKKVKKKGDPTFREPPFADYRLFMNTNSKPM